MSAEDDITKPGVVRPDVESPAETDANFALRLAIENSKLRRELDELKHPPLEHVDSAEAFFSGSGNHLEFRTRGKFWTRLLAYSWRKASAWKKAQLVTGAVTFQGVIIALVELARKYGPLLLHSVVSNAGK